MYRTRPALHPGTVTRDTFWAPMFKKILRIREMESSHLENTIAMINREGWGRGSKRLMMRDAMILELESRVPARIKWLAPLEGRGEYISWGHYRALQLGARITRITSKSREI